MLTPIRTAAPAVVPVSLDEAKAHLRVTASGEDDLIASLVDAAVSHIDGWNGVLGRCLINQDWRASYCDWPACGTIELPFPNVSAVTVKYSDADNSEQTVSSSQYQLLECPIGSCVIFNQTFTWPNLYPYREDRVRVDLTAGYGTAAENVPQALRQAILLHVSKDYWSAKQNPFLSQVRVEGVSERRYIVSDVSMNTISRSIDALIGPFRRVRM